MRWIVLLLLVGTSLGCPPAQQRCNFDGECTVGVCRDGFCQNPLPEPDAGVVGVDVETDAGTDAGPSDAGPDDAGPDDAGLPIVLAVENVSVRVASAERVVVFFDFDDAQSVDGFRVFRDEVEVATLAPEKRAFDDRGTTGGAVHVYRLEAFLGSEVGPSATVTTPRLPPDRVGSGLIARYDFAEGAGTTTADLSGVLPLKPLEGVGDFSWLDEGGVEFTGLGQRFVASSSGKLAALPAAENALTVEAWIAVDNPQHTGPTRVVTSSLNPGLRNYTLGFDKSALHMRLRTASTGENGTTGTPVATGVVRGGAVQHVAVTFAGGITRISVDGDLVRVAPSIGPLANFNSAFAFAVGDENSQRRPFLGRVFQVAVYQRGLSGAEVRQNHAAGLPLRFDDDLDGVDDSIDVCPGVFDNQADADADGRGDACDRCPGDSDSLADDVDFDGVVLCDLCPNAADRANGDADDDGAGDACDPDIDGDGTLNDADLCPRSFDPAGLPPPVDFDLDGVGDSCENCPDNENADQLDKDEDGVGDACDPDRDGDGVPNGVDNCQFSFNPDQEDSDGQGFGDLCAEQAP